MLLRRGTLAHPNGQVVDLPLLVPSLSSKGFGFFSEPAEASNEDTVPKVEYSETLRALEWVGGLPQSSLLISAYDIFHSHYRKPETCLKNAGLIFVDSGGYELSPEFDSTEPKHYPHKAKKFTEQNYISVLDSIYARADIQGLVVANFDWTSRHKPIEEQIQNAQALFARYPKAIGNFILKPHKQHSHVLDIDELVRHAAKLRNFGIIGITEKELGKNLMDRLRRIAQLRKSLLERKINSPIHIWGGLDPVITPLYFFAGAEIFDGVSWLRYSFQKGIAVQRECHGVLSSQGIETTADHMFWFCVNDNLTVLQRLATSLMEFADSGAASFASFEHNADEFARAYRTMTTKIPDMKGGD